MASENQRFISVIGAAEHNLKNIAVEIPRDSLTVITGEGPRDLSPAYSIKSTNPSAFNRFCTTSQET
jgi:excinuclease UvrABC ATPase subunit